ncbi:lactonase family protein [Sphingomonas sp. RIT328]|uniref:lactonase family protein n=1 Tax=Sphingomonas sp. RIT328 TaxID=1470591 RepID=UPI000445CB18|nr:beta-propeller fold lactonase family protein [Sphingomonas sp. RIT328]EZP55573.1 Tat (Twin-arginine translocation) pathway signal sequence domain protein [Sphingomonas sp. RIT328]
MTLDRRALLAGIGASVALPAAAAPPREGVAASSDGGAFALGAAGGVRRLALPDGLEWTVPDGTGRLAVFSGKAGGRLIGFDAGWRSRGAAATGGHEPVHLAIAPDRSVAAVADYSGGTVSVHRLRDGVPGAAQIVRHHGRGPNAARQAEPHPHWVGFGGGGRWLYAVDLGADAVFAHRIVGGRVVDTMVAWQAPPGSGPRHIAWHPDGPLAYLVSELDSRLTTLRIEADGRFTTIGAQPTLPAGREGYVGHVAVDAAGKRLYASNRGPNTIAVFALDDPLRPRLIEQAPCGGDWPRFFLLRPEAGEMLVANERSPAMAVLPLLRDGRLGAARAGPAVPKARFAAW